MRTQLLHVMPVTVRTTVLVSRAVEEEVCAELAAAGAGVAAVLDVTSAAPHPASGDATTGKSMNRLMGSYPLVQ